MSENISCGLKITSPQDTVCDFLRRESAGLLGVKIEGLAMTVAGSLLVYLYFICVFFLSVYLFWKIIGDKASLLLICHV